MKANEEVKQQFQRTAALIGADACYRLADAKVLVFGLGGVGSSASARFCSQNAS